MTQRVESYVTSGEGELLLPAWGRGLDDLRIYASVLTVSDTPYENYRLYSPRSFYGYIQFFDGEAVINSVALEYSSQRVYARDECCVAALEDRCRKYSCLAIKLDWIGNLLTLAFPPISAAIGAYPLTSDAANFGDILIVDSPTTIAWQWQPGVSVLIEITGDEPSLSNCNPATSSLAPPGGCRQPGEPVPRPGSCIPTVPTGGGGS